MIANSLKKGANKIAPSLTSYAKRHLRGFRSRQKLIHEATDLRKRCQNAATLDSAMDIICTSKRFAPKQMQHEFLDLLWLLEKHQPKYICEIGSARGGTLALFCQIAAANARLLAIDIDFTNSRVKALKHFAVKPQEITCIAGDSKASETLRQVEEWLGENKLDFLFVDGDHTKQGVTNDFNNFLPYMRDGGIIGFHDIVPDSKMRNGIESSADVGQVPEFWSELKEHYSNTLELIEDLEQDGYGIGVLRLKSN